jgi:DNA polymerase III subunit gamma/tau
VESPLALYRRYRPETFAEVIGQDHVTEPLRAALANNRVNHAYLFSGPRGCGKTTSARILARSLNCEQAPTADPCGKCDSCRDLARGGPGSIDVIEIDAASHGGVDDARDLREKAFFAPVKSHYKVYIIDEAHMVSTQGFNALLKLVEEPPEHLRFIFATTEPEKVLPTIRSRTHHYPFRLIPPRLLSSYLGELCEREGVAIEQAALPLVVRAGGGSARDTLSVLDQLLGGAGPEGVTHALATGLLGYTPDTLLDEVVDSFAAGDGGAVFGVVDKIIETGQDPRRFAEDLLRRLRDLVIVAAVPDAPATGLIDCSEDQGERLVAQAARFGGVELSRAADLVAAGLTEMRGATAPRLLLELICARVLLPGADDTDDGVLARLDRIERRMSVQGGVSSPKAEPPAPRQGADPVHAPASEGRGAAAAGLSAPQPRDEQPQSPPPTEPVQVETSSLSLVDVRRLWPDIVEATKQRRRVTWIHLTQHAQVVAADETSLTLGFSNAGARDSFANGGSLEIVRQAAIDVVGKDWKIEAIVDPSARAAGGADASDTSEPTRREAPGPPAPVTPAPAAQPDAPPDWAVDRDPAPRTPSAASAPVPEASRERVPATPTTTPATTPTTKASPEAIARARESLGKPRAGEPARPDPRLADADAHPDDPDVEDSGLEGAELLQRHLGAEVIEEIPHD